MAKRSQELSVALNVRLPRGLYDKLQAVGGEGGMSAVVRDVLERGLAAEAPAVADEKTGELLRFVAEAAKAIEEGYGKPWHGTVFLSEAMREAVGTHINDSGAVGPLDEGGRPTNWFGPDEDFDESAAPVAPDPHSTLGQILAQPSMRVHGISKQLLAEALLFLRIRLFPPKPSTAAPFPILPPPEPKG